MALRQLRKFTLTIAMLLFPITIWYFSPYLIIMAAARHVINGSFIVFTLMFVFGIFFGRLWCGWFCPTGGMSECFSDFSPKSPKQGWRNYLKYGIWIVWISGVAGCKSCQKVCPMALDVPALARRGEINSAECVLCGECVAACKTGALQYKITNKRGRND